MKLDHPHFLLDTCPVIVGSSCLKINSPQEKVPPPEKILGETVHLARHQPDLKTFDLEVLDAAQPGEGGE